MNCIAFGEALKQGKTPQGRPTLLLGNGFSIAYDCDIFSYKALFASVFTSVDELQAQRVGQVFEALKTVDCEVAIRNLEVAASIAGIYEWGEEKSGVLCNDADFLKDALIQAVQSTHPAHIFEIDPDFIFMAHCIFSNVTENWRKSDTLKVVGAD